MRAVVDLDLLADAPDDDRAGLPICESGVDVPPSTLWLRAGDRVAVRAGGRVAEQQDELLLDVGRDRVLPAVGLAVHLLPLEPDHVDEQAFGEPVAPHDRGRHLAALVGEAQAAIVEQLGVAVVDEPVHRLRHRGGRQPEALDQTGADRARCLPPRSRGSLRGTPRSCRGTRPPVLLLRGSGHLSCRVLEIRSAACGRSSSVPRSRRGLVPCGGSSAKYLDRDTDACPRIDTANEPRELAWTSVTDARQTAKTSSTPSRSQSWIRLAPNWTGTEVEYGVRFPRELVKRRRHRRRGGVWSRNSRT